ncbi:MAG: hypothetical protein CVV13_04055 [Gammaproteobacteria bacterium HGW-Gammaproteobacteria-3]|nr:MAG: hypothetical protein CVV13_04055 [Gammaproteobacteria bacterium HGW-Gammaproteobacteria-3]
MKKVTGLSVIMLVLCSLHSGFVWARGGHGGGGHGGGHYGGGHGGGHYSHHGGGHGGGHHGHASYGFYFGAPYYSYPYYSYPYYSYPYYAPTIITAPSSPPVYIQQSPQVTQQYQTGYWYYCANPEGYYPYVKDCPDGWQQVEPTPLR